MREIRKNANRKINPSSVNTLNFLQDTVNIGCPSAFHIYSSPRGSQEKSCSSRFQQPVSMRRRTDGLRFSKEVMVLTSMQMV